MKTYVLQIDSALYPKGTEARKTEVERCYDLFSSKNENLNEIVYSFNIENRPEVWKLKEEENKQVNEYLPFIPIKGENYYYVGGAGTTAQDSNECSVDNCIAKQGVFRTEKAAQMEALRRESRAKAWMPKKREVYYFCGIITGDIESEIYDPTYSYNIMEFLQGNTHETEAKAQEWKEKYYEAFKVLFE